MKKKLLFINLLKLLSWSWVADFKGFLTVFFVLYSIPSSNKTGRECFLQTSRVKWGCDVKNKWCNRQPLARWELEVLTFKLSSDKGNMWLITKVSLKILFRDTFVSLDRGNVPVNSKTAHAPSPSSEL